MEAIVGAATGAADGDIFWMFTVVMLASLITPAILLALVIYSVTKRD